MMGLREGADHLHFTLHDRRTSHRTLSTSHCFAVRSIDDSVKSDENAPRMPLFTAFFVVCCIETICKRSLPLMVDAHLFFLFLLF